METYKSIDIVLQGKCYDITKKIINEYKKLSFVNKIYLSSYDEDFNFEIPDNVYFINNKIIEPNGLGNRNLQINTSINGIKNVNSKICIKMRTDQLISLDSMNKMHEYWIKYNSKNKIFVLGMYKKFPYHPRDHVFWGFTEDIYNLFNIPFDKTKINLIKNDISIYLEYTRAETYICQYYYAKFDNSIYEHIENPKIYLVDKSPKINESLKKDFAIRDSIFSPFPRVNICWPKAYKHDSFELLRWQSNCEIWGNND